MDDQNKNLILATVLSFLVILVWFVLFPPEEVAIDPAQQEIAQSDPAADPLAPAPVRDGVDVAAATEAMEPEVAEAARITIDTPRLSGTLSLQGGRIDDLALKDYRETIDPDSPIVQLLRPVGGRNAYYALYGWSPGGTLGFEDVPGPNTVWTQVGGTTLTPDAPVTLEWQNGNGLTFTRVVEIDEDFLFTVTQSVTNAGDEAVRLYPYGQVARHGVPDNLENFFILHEGLVMKTDGQLTEDSYSDISGYVETPQEGPGARAEVIEVASQGWLGFTDKYWMATLIPTPGDSFTAVARYLPGTDVFLAETRKPVMTVAPGETASSTTMLFAGAKEWETIRGYEREVGIEKFIDSIDWGWFFFLTKPIFAVLHWINGLIGNMGWAIIGLTLMLKALLFPLAYKSYVSMARMKELQPEMEKIKERVGDDRQKLQQEMMTLYREKKVNPAAGCLPILLQIPIFFSLYKVIFVTIELRHAPWFGWIQDLSAPDPSSLYNLWGLLPWAAPEPGSILALIFIGILPLFLGVSMWLQMRLNPMPTDPIQATIFNWMPWIFMFMLGSFASGLVIYWIANNVITFTQQYIIMWRHGHRPDLLGNIKSSVKRKPVTAKKPAEK